MTTTLADVVIAWLHNAPCGIMPASQDDIFLTLAITADKKEICKHKNLKRSQIRKEIETHMAWERRKITLKRKETHTKDSRKAVKNRTDIIHALKIPITLAKATAFFTLPSTGWITRFRAREIKSPSMGHWIDCAAREIIRVGTTPFQIQWFVKIIVHTQFSRDIARSKLFCEL